MLLDYGRRASADSAVRRFRVMHKPNGLPTAGAGRRGTGEVLARRVGKADDAKGIAGRWRELARLAGQRNPSGPTKQGQKA